MKEHAAAGRLRVVPYYALTRFGRWDEMLASPRRPPTTRTSTGTWHYARGLALVGNRRLDEAERELAEVKRVARDNPLDYPLFSPNTAATILAIGPEVLAGELAAAARKDFDAAIGHLERAVRLEDGLVYTEPAEWHYPPRHALGAVLLQAGRAREAETVYWEDLKRNPENGWALFGLRPGAACAGQAGRRGAGAATVRPGLGARRRDADGVAHNVAIVTRPTADLCDDHGEDVRVLAPGLRDFGGVTSFAGPVTTLRVHEDNALVRATLDSAGEGRVLVVDGGGSLRCALVGGNLAALAARQGWAGLVVWGAVRDVAELRACRVGVRALASNPRKSNQAGIGDRDVPVTVAGVRVAPGEWLAADGDGIIVSLRPLA